MSKQKGLKALVFKALRDDEPSRNSDVRLFNYILINHFPSMLSRDADGDYIIKLRRIYDVPSQDNIKRVRASIQNKDHQFLPSSPTVRKQRRINERDWYLWALSCG